MRVKVEMSMALIPSPGAVHQWLLQTLPATRFALGAAQLCWWVIAHGLCCEHRSVPFSPTLSPPPPPPPPFPMTPPDTYPFCYCTSPACHSSHTHHAVQPQPISPRHHLLYSSDPHLHPPPSRRPQLGTRASYFQGHQPSRPWAQWCARTRALMRRNPLPHPRPRRWARGRSLAS